jgi:hypothetical protein
VQGIGIGLAVFTILYSLLRGGIVLWDSRDYFKLS